MRPWVANLHPFKKACKCQLVTPPPLWQHWTFSNKGQGRRGRGRGWKWVWVRCAGVSRERSEEGQSVPELRAKQPLSAVKFVAEGGQSGPGRRRWRVGGGRSCSRGWLHYLYLQWLSWSHYLSHSSFPFFLSRSSFKPLFVSPFLSCFATHHRPVLSRANSIFCNCWHLQIVQIKFFSRDRNVICTA